MRFNPPYSSQSTVNPLDKKRDNFVEKFPSRNILFVSLIITGPASDNKINASLVLMCLRIASDYHHFLMADLSCANSGYFFISAL